METKTAKSNPRMVCNGRELREMFCHATRWLEKNAAAINSLNVFPVPDGDTGTNMLLTMRSTMAEAANPPDTSAADIAKAMARGALMGARGNSGVILSQIMKGFARGLGDQTSFGPADVANALEQATEAAYQSMSKPREGTMLTVIKDSSLAARNCVSRDGHDLASLMQEVVDEARKSVERTPQLLDVLREAGVVDAGGQGIYVIFEGVLSYLRGEPDLDDRAANLATKKDMPVAKQPAILAARAMPQDGRKFGYCTEMIIKGSALSQDRVRYWVESQGDSVLVVADGETTKVHVHTPHPGTIVEFAISIGSVHDLKIQNMDDQHEEFVELRRAPAPISDVSVVSVVAGVGLEKVFRSLGTSYVVSGGQTMNPSCADLLEAINSVPSQNVVLLPNNKNIIPTAKQAVALADKTVRVLPTRSIPQGLAALVGFNREMQLDTNLKDMTQAQGRVRSIEITTAVRDARRGSLQIARGSFIGLVDGDIKVASTNLEQTVIESLQTVSPETAGIISLFYGDQVEAEQAMQLGDCLKRQYKGVEIEVVAGGQPHYPYIISLE